jgi:CrcB protein
MSWKAILAVALGASLGAILRWQLGLRLNAWFPLLPPGTLIANLLGAYVIGVALAIFAQMPNLSPEWRLLWITGFCGGLTTFSTFSAETFNLLQLGRVGWALGLILVHVLGSVLMTWLGILTWQWLRAH